MRDGRSLSRRRFLTVSGATPFFRTSTPTIPLLQSDVPRIRWTESFETDAATTVAVDAAHGEGWTITGATDDPGIGNTGWLTHMRPNGSTQWQWTSDEGGVSVGLDVSRCDDGYAVAGKPTREDDGVALVVVNEAGQTEFATHGTPVDATQWGLDAAHVVPRDGSGYVVGFREASAEWNRTTVDGYARDGTHEWSHRFTRGYDVNFLLDWSDDEVVVGGEKDDSALWLATLDDDGDVRSEKVFDSIGVPDVSDAVLTPDGGLMVLAGEQVVKLDPGFDVVWQRAFSEVGLSVTEDANSRKIVRTPDDHYVALLNGGSDGKFSLDGSPIWSKEFDYEHRITDVAAFGPNSFVVLTHRQYPEDLRRLHVVSENEQPTVTPTESDPATTTTTTDTVSRTTRTTEDSTVGIGSGFGITAGIAGVLLAWLFGRSKRDEN